MVWPASDSEMSGPRRSPCNIQGPWRGQEDASCCFHRCPNLRYLFLCCNRQTSFIMRPYLLQGHERPITVVKYNFDGDLLFTASKDQIPSVWRSENGERLGTYAGHKGTIWDLDVDRFTNHLLTASADATVKLWRIQTGECLETFPHRGPVRGVAWAEDNRRFATISDPFVEHNAKISIFEVDSTTPVLEIDIPKDSTKRVNATNIKWTYLNEHLFVSFDNGTVRLYDPHSGHVVNTVKIHEKKINRVQFNSEKTLFITASADFTSKLYDAVHLTHLKTYKTDRPVNDAVISEHKDHILLGGGQEAMSVTTTAGKVGKFETRFFHLVYQEEFGCVKGHFGPINALAINPNGLNYASGAEDGYVRLHHFDKSYLDMVDPVPEEDEPLYSDDEEEEEEVAVEGEEDPAKQ